MVINNKPRESEQDDVLDSLMKLPARNLEARIRQLEAEIAARKSISSNILSDLGTRKLQLEQRAWQQRYAGFAGAGTQARDEAERQRIKAEFLTHQELVACFQDLFRICEQLQQAREQLTMEQEKLKLLRSDSDQKAQPAQRQEKPRLLQSKADEEAGDIINKDDRNT